MCGTAESYRLHGFVAEPPQAIAGGHLFFPLQDGVSRINCAAFEPTKNFRAIVKQLILGDELEVYGSVQEGTLNLEKINILHLGRYCGDVCPHLSPMPEREWSPQARVRATAAAAARPMPRTACAAFSPETWRRATTRSLPVLAAISPSRWCA